MVNTSPGPDAAQILRPVPLETLVSKKTLTFWIVLLVTLVIDQATKFWVYLNLELYKDEVVVIPGLFSVVHAQNPGAAFSVLSNFEYRQYVFLVVIAVAIYIVAQLQRELSDGDAALSDRYITAVHMQAQYTHSLPIGTCSYYHATR